MNRTMEKQKIFYNYVSTKSDFFFFCVQNEMTALKTGLSLAVCRQMVCLSPV